MGDVTENPIRIFVLDRGFVFVGRLPDVTECGLWVTATDCRCIRVWGTTQGLGELVNGPKDGTRLDDLIPSTTFAVRALIFTINEVNQDKWTPYLKPSSTKKQTRQAGAAAK